MGEIKTVVSGDLTLQKVFNTVTVEQVLSKLKDMYSGEPTKYIVWDLTEASAKLLQTKDLDQIVQYVEQFDHIRAGGKTAIIAPRNLEYGIGRMLNTYADLREVAFKLSVFREAAEAAQWIGVDKFPDIK